MRFYKYKNYKRIRQLTVDENQIFNDFISLFPNLFDKFSPQIVLNEFLFNLPALDYITIDKIYLYSPRADVFCVKDNFATIIELKFVADLFSLLQTNYYVQLANKYFKDFNLTKAVILTRYAIPQIETHAKNFDIIVLQIPETNPSNFKFLYGDFSDLFKTSYI